MNLTNIPLLRMSNQCISESLFERPEEVVSWFGAVQSQDYAAAKWAVGLRSVNLTDGLLDNALAEGRILRTHLLRPTWHFVAPSDIRWILQLTAPRIHKQMAHWYRSSGLDGQIQKKTDAAISQALQGHRQLTRSELAVEIRKSVPVNITNLQITFLMLHAELEGIVCSGGLKGKAHTYALLDERVPQTKTLTHEEALCKLTKRYFRSHGPATARDFCWWASLPMVEAKTGIDMLTFDLQRATIGGKDYFFMASKNESSPPTTVVLLPNYDEYIVGYTDRTAVFDKKNSLGLDSRQNPLFQNTLVVNGKIVGNWKRTFQDGKVNVFVKPFENLPAVKRALIDAAVKRYAKFLELMPELIL
jgi:hypothetical protein